MKLPVVLAAMALIMGWLLLGDRAETDPIPSIRGWVDEPWGIHLGIEQQDETSNRRLRMLTGYDSKQLDMLSKMYYGTWRSPVESSPFGTFDSRSGEVEVYFIFNNTLEPDVFPYANTAVLIFMDPEYVDQKVAVLLLPLLQSFSSQKQLWEGRSNTSSLVHYYQFHLRQRIDGVDLSFILNETHAQLNASSLFEIEIEKHERVYHSAAPWVLLIPSLLMLLALRFAVRALIPPMKISVLSLLFNLNFLLFVALLELYNGLDNIENSEGWMLLAGALTFCCSMYFTRDFEETIRRIATVRGYLWFYFVSFLYLWCLFNYHFKAWFQLLNSLVLLPQIVHNAWNGLKPASSLSFFSVLLVNQLYMFYYRGVAHNIMRTSPDLRICAGICQLLALQLIVVVLQSRYGSRFFLPKRCLPQYHDYYLELDRSGLNTQLLGEDCAICLFPLGEEPNDQPDPELPDKKPKWQRKRIMKTPCNHMFHVVCLENWMEHKFECPIDRSALPPYQ